MNSNVLYPISYNKDMEISLVQGNKKIGHGVFALNLLPGDQPISTKTRGQLTDIKGTCGGCCEGCVNDCYAMRDAKRYHNACIPSLGKNTLIMRHNIDGMFAQLEEKLTKKNAKVLRYHSSGEIENFNYLLHMVKLAVRMPNVKFYCYTKRFNLYKSTLLNTECSLRILPLTFLYGMETTRDTTLKALTSLCMTMVLIPK